MPVAARTGGGGGAYLGSGSPGLLGRFCSFLGRVVWERRSAAPQGAERRDPV